MSAIFWVFWSFSRALGCLERSGGPVGFISTKFRPNLTPGDRVMAKKLRVQTDRVQTDRVQTDRIQTDRVQTDRVQIDR